MDAFVVVTKPSTSSKRAAASGGKQDSKATSSSRYAPYSTDANRAKTFDGISTQNPIPAKKKRKPLLTADGKVASPSAIRKHLFSTLHEETNPITHSDVYARTDHVTSTATGHQRSDGRNANSTVEYLTRRKEKLEGQLAEARREAERLTAQEAEQLTAQEAGPSSNLASQEQAGNTTNTNVLRNVKAYIDGFLENTTDIEMKRIITEAGGEVLYSASGATHILTSQQLSGSKTHRLLTQKKMKVRPHVVRPEWVFDSLERGRRVPEREYSVLRDEGNRGLVEMFGVGKGEK